MATSTTADTVSAPADPDSRSLGLQARVIFLIVLTLASMAIFWPRGDGTSLAPAGFLLDASGRPTKLGDHMTPVVLLHFWATWCPPCVTEIPALQRLATDFGGRPGFQIMMVAVDDELEKVRPFVGNQRAFSVLYDPQWEVSHRYGTRKLPETYVIVRGRKIEKLKFIGATNWDDPKIRAALSTVIEMVDAGEEMEQILLAIEGKGKSST